MSRYVLDTNIILIYLKDVFTKKLIEDKFSPFSDDNVPIISAVTIGELKSIAKQNNWGTKRIRAVQDLLDTFVVIGVRFEDIFDAYAEIDAFSQGKLEHPRIKFSSRNMGKNDLWIAATALVTDSMLLTTDKDFDHLDGEFIQVEYIERVQK
ncbi:MAG: PIN domain-containing protein [Bacteroidota bacterium]